MTQVHLIVDSAGNAVNFATIQQSFSSFGEQLIAELQPSVNIYFPYIINSGIIFSSGVGGGTTIQESGMAKLSTGASSGDRANMHSLKAVRYTPGQGVNIRFTALFPDTTGDGSTQWIGVGNEEDGFFFGCSGNELGILHRQFGIDNFIPQSGWNKDKFQGDPVEIDKTKGNVYVIQYQWLGFGDIRFSIENPIDGVFNKAHVIEYANANDKPVVSNPSMNLWTEVNNPDADEDVILRTSSMGAFIEGPKQGQILNFAVSGSAVLSSDSLFNVLTLRNNAQFAGQKNRANVFATFLSVSNDGNKDVLIKLISNATISSPTFNDIDSTRSRCAVDIVGTSPVEPSGNLQVGFTIAKNSSLTLSLEDLDIFIHPGETLTVAAERGGVASLVVGAFLRCSEEY